MRLRHGALGAVEHVGNKVRRIRQISIAAVDVASLLFVYQEQMVCARAACDVDVLAQLDIAICAKDGQPPIAPVIEAIRRVPVDADIAPSAIATQKQFTKVLQFRVDRVREIPYRRCDDVGISRSGKGQKLLDLVAGDVAQHAAIPVTLEEPCRPKLSVEPVRTKPYSLNNAANGSGLHQFDRTRHCAYFDRSE